MKIRSLRLSARILLMIIPSMSVLLFILAQFVYSGLYETIKQGFENKLRVLGSLNSSLIDGKKHLLLNDFRQETAVSYDPVNDCVYFGCATGKFITRMNESKNKFDKWLSPELTSVAHLAFDQLGRKLLSVEYQGSNIFVHDPKTCRVQKTIACPGELQGLACEKSNLYVVITNTLLYKNMSDPHGEWIASGIITTGYIWGLTVDSQGKLAALDMKQSAIIRFPATNATLSETLLINTKTETSGKMKYLPLRGIARVGKKYICGSPIEPVSIAVASGVLRPLQIGQDAKRSLRDLYAELVGILSRVRQKSGLTYMPSVVLTQDLQSLMYVVDSATDEFHSLDGYVDPTVLEEGIIDSWIKNQPYISAVKFWEDYGLMKSSYYPILGTDGTIRALLAADINVSIIKVKTMEAVQRVAVSGSVTLLIGILLAFSIAKRVVKPVMLLKEFALRVAAGGYGEEIKASGADEIKQLMIEYNTVSVNMGRTLEVLHASTTALDTARKMQELQALLEKMAGAVVSGPSYKASRMPGSKVSLCRTKNTLCIIGGLRDVKLASALSVVVQDTIQTMGDKLFEMIKGMGVRYTFCILWHSQNHALSWDCGSPLDVYLWRKKKGTLAKARLEGRNALQLDDESMAWLGYQKAEVLEMLHAGGEKSTSKEQAETSKENFKLMVVNNEHA